MFNFISKYSKLLFFTWLILIFIASSLPQLPTPKITTSVGTTIRLDYLIHFLEFLVLSVLFILWRMNRESKEIFLVWIIFGLLGIAFSFIIEIYQLIIPGRAFNIVDCYFNTLGLVTGIVLLGFVYRKKKWLSII